MPYILISFFQLILASNLFLVKYVVCFLLLSIRDNAVKHPCGYNFLIHILFQATLLPG